MARLTEALAYRSPVPEIGLRRTSVCAVDSGTQAARSRAGAKVAT